MCWRGRQAIIYEAAHSHATFEDTYHDSGQRPIPAQTSSPRRRLQGKRLDLFAMITQDEESSPGVMPTMLPPPLPPDAKAMPGVMPTMEPLTVWPKCSTSTSEAKLKDINY